MSNTYTAVRRLQFCAGHRVYKHESKCANLHGHNYVVYIHARPKPHYSLDEIGRVIDFSELKQKVGSWIDTYWDHGFIYYSEDPELKLIHHTFDDKKFYVLPTNPTAENMSSYLLDVCEMLFKDSDIEVFKIVLWETENCFAEVEK